MDDSGDGSIENLVGLTLTECFQRRDREVVFKTESRLFRLCHLQDCCESVRVDEIHGDLSDLVGAEILYADEASSYLPANAADNSQKWTFYRISTIKGSVTIRFFGTSNGYYSTRVDFVEGEDEFEGEREFFGEEGGLFEEEDKEEAED